MNLADFFNPEVVGAGVTLGVMTVLVTGTAGILVFKLFREKSVIAPVAEASTAGNATATPAAISAAAAVAASSGMMTEAEAQKYHDIVNIATAQISLAVITTAILCPIAVILVDRYQRRKGIDGKAEDI